MPPLLLRNLWIEGWIFADYDLQFFGLSNIPDVLTWLASFITHSDVGLFTLLFVIPLLFALILLIKDVLKLNAEISVWILLAIISFSVFVLYPTDQPRLYSFFFWLIPMILLMQCWDKGWEITCVLFAGWQVLIFGAIPFSPQGWIIDGASSYLSRVDGIIRPLPTADVALSYIGSLLLVAFWFIFVFVFKTLKKESPFEEMTEEDGSSE